MSRVDAVGEIPRSSASPARCGAGRSSSWSMRIGVGVLIFYVAVALISVRLDAVRSADARHRRRL